MPPRFISREEGEARLDWLPLIEALEAGHRLPRAQVADSFLYRSKDTLLTRSAWIDGLGLCTKTATIFPGNPERGVPSVNGGVSLCDDRDGRLTAVIDFQLVTVWKTVGDSLLAARHLARPESREVLILGAGRIAEALIGGYRALFPQARITLWNRSAGRAQVLAERSGAMLAGDLEAAVRGAEVIAAATMSTQPLIRGAWLQPGQHLDLIGAFRPDMREADDAALQRASIFVDNRATVLDHIGELKIPLESGAIAKADVVADLYDLPSGRFARTSEAEITLFKNGGGAHLDLMTARHILEAVSAAGG